MKDQSQKPQHAPIQTTLNSSGLSRDAPDQELTILKQKIERRQQQNREAARKSRQRKRQQVAKLEEENAILRQLLSTGLEDSKAGGGRPEKSEPGIATAASPSLLHTPEVSRSGNQACQSIEEAAQNLECNGDDQQGALGEGGSGEGHGPEEGQDEPIVDPGKVEQVSGYGQNNGNGNGNGYSNGHTL